MTNKYQLHLLEPTAQVLSHWLTEEESAKLTSGLRTVYETFSKLTTNSLAERQAKLLAKPNLLCQHSMGCKVNAVRGLVQSFGVAYSVKVAAGVIALALRGGSKPWAPFRRSAIVSLFGRDSLSFAMFIASFVSGYKLLLCLIRRLSGKNKSWYGFFAGSLAGASLLIDSNHDRRVAVALYLAIRVAHFSFRWIWKHCIEPSSLVAKRQGVDKPRKSSIRIKSVLSSSSGGSILSREGSNSSESSHESLSVPQTKSLQTLETSSAEATVDRDQFYKEKQLIRRIVSPFIMAFASSQIFAAFQLAPETLPVPYLSFLFTHSGVRSSHKHMYKQVQQQMKQLNLSSNLLGKGGSSDGLTTLMDSYDSLKQLPGTDLNLEQFVAPKLLLVNPGQSTLQHNPAIACNMVHYWTPSCTAASGYLWCTEFGRALKLYGSLYAVFTLLFRYRTVARDPVRVGKSFLSSTTRSAIFLATFVALAGGIGCLLRKSIRRDITAIFYVAGGLAGLLSLPIESPNRQLEIAYYCLPRAVESLWRYMCTLGYVYSVPVYEYLGINKLSTKPSRRSGSGGEVIYFMIVTGLMMLFYQNEPDVITGGYRKVLARFMNVN